MKPLIRETQDKKYFEVIGHYDNPILCAKLTAIADLFAIEKKEGYAKFRIEDESKLAVIDDGLKFVGAQLYMNFYTSNCSLTGSGVDIISAVGPVDYQYDGFVNASSLPATITITPNNGYELPSSITVVSGSTPLPSYAYSYNPSSGVITLNSDEDWDGDNWDFWSDITVTIVCPEAQVSVPASSFKSIKLNGNVLTINGTDYTLDGTSEVVDANESSFKGISAVDNGNGTITLTVGNNSITVNKHSALITFTINNVSYQAEQGMTWAQWIASAYNTDGYETDSVDVYLDNSPYYDYVQLSGTNVSPSDTITANTSYSIYRVNSGGGGGN